MLYDTYGEEYLAFLQELNEILSVTCRTGLPINQYPKTVQNEEPQQRKHRLLEFYSRFERHAH